MDNLKEHLKQHTEQKPAEKLQDKKAPHAEHSAKTENTAPKALNDALAEAQKERDEWKHKALLIAADMENLRKRLAHDMENHTKFANASFAKDLLPVADCIDKAVECAKSDTQTPQADFLKNMVAGLEMVQKQMSAMLKKHGIEKMETLGKVFDPNLHQVIAQVDNPDAPSGTILQEMQSGYTIGGDRVLREAIVTVSK